MTAAALGGLVVGAVHGDRSADALRSKGPLATANLDNAYYRCVDAQAHSLVTGDQPVHLAYSVANFANYVALVKATASWVHLVAHPGVSTVSLTLVNQSGPASCLGTRVQAVTRLPGGHVAVRQGTGASLPGKGPPPAPPS